MIDERTLPVRVVHDDGRLKLITGGFLARYPARTRQLYEIHLRQWIGWAMLHGLDPLEARRGHIEAWGRHLGEERALKASTVKGKLNTICGMYRFAAADGLIEHDPGAYVRRPRIDFVSTTQGLARAQLADLLKAAEEAGPRTYAWVCLLALNGLRIGELMAADVEHLGFERGYRTIYLPCRKGGKVGTLALSVRTAWALDRYVGPRTTGPLLVGDDGLRMRAGAVRRQLRRLVTSIGVTKRITPHSLRHSFVTAALDAGVPERDLMDSTGHQSPIMLRYYDRNRGGIERNATHAVSAFIGAAS